MLSPFVKPRDLGGRTAKGKERMSGHRLIVLGVVIAALLGGTAYVYSRPVPTSSVSVTFVQNVDGSLAISYDWDRPQSTLAFNKLPDGYRARQWKLENDGYTFTRSNEIRRDDRRKFSHAEINASPDVNRLSKDYQPVVHYGNAGVLIYTGHFWPVDQDGKRAEARFNFAPLPDSAVFSFGEHASEFRSWQSPINHPAFVYMGPMKPLETEQVIALTDPETPAWIKQEFNAVVPRSFDVLSDIFGYGPDHKPNLFLTVRLGDDPGRLSYAGDALPDQFQITLEGQGWAQPSEKGRKVFVHSTVHEAVHLWQAVARPSASGVPGWLHEGAADAITAEIMVTTGLWDGADFHEDEVRARKECAERLYYGPISSAEKRGDFRALYACGQVIAQAVSLADKSSTGEFWRAFIGRAEGGGKGYDDEMYFALVADRTNNPAFARTLRRFARTPFADPERAINQLFDEASAVSR